MSLSNQTYNTLKWIAQILLPALATLYLALAGLWGFPHTEAVVGTITALDTFLGALLGLGLRLILGLRLGSGRLRGGGSLGSGRGHGLDLRGGLGDPGGLSDGDLLPCGQRLTGIGGEDANTGGHTGSLDGPGGGDLGPASSAGTRGDHGQGKTGRCGDCQTPARGGSKVIQWGKSSGGFAVTCDGA